MVGIRFEERDLVAHYGEDYQRYRHVADQEEANDRWRGMSVWTDHVVAALIRCVDGPSEAVLDRHRPSFVVFPLALDLEVVFGVAFLDESDAFEE